MKKTSFIIMITVLILGAAISPRKSHADASVSMNGFVIEADRVEGVMGIPGIINGETATQENNLMLRLTFSKATIYGLTITKVLNTPNGPVTIQFKSTGPVELSNMAVDVTKIEFGGIYLPNKLGELGMKNVRLVAHKQTADDAILPALVASVDEKGANVDTTSDSEKNLAKQAELLKKILGDSKDGNLQELNKILQPKKEEEKNSMDQSNEKQSDDPLDEINKIPQSSKSGKKEDDTNNNAVSEDKINQSTKNEQNTDKIDSKTTSNTEEKANSNQNNQQSDSVQQTEENNPGTNDANSDSSIDSTTSGDTKQSSDTAEEPPPSTPPAGDANSGSTKETKHTGGLLDLLRGLFP